MIHFTLYSRSYCHLCDDMLQALNRFGGQYSFEVSVVDVDLDADLATQYDELVPVLVGRKDGGMPVQLCHYFLDEAKVSVFLADD